MATGPFSSMFSLSFEISRSCLKVMWILLCMKWKQKQLVLETNYWSDLNLKNVFCMAKSISNLDHFASLYVQKYPCMCDILSRAPGRNSAVAVPPIPHSLPWKFIKTEMYRDPGCGPWFCLCCVRGYWMQKYLFWIHRPCWPVKHTDPINLS